MDFIHFLNLLVEFEIIQSFRITKERIYIIIKK